MKEQLGIYIHVPFCVRKCAYCDFYSLAYSKDVAAAYVSRIISEAYRWGDVLGHPPADTLYFGGGTPSLLEKEQIKAITAACRTAFKMPSAEITLEVNPAEELGDFFSFVAGAGVNRISIGMQSANDNELQLLSRRHTAAQTEKTVRAAQRAGIDNISLDVMLGIPSQTLNSLQNTLSTALGLGAEHISAYLLSLEEGTPLYKNRQSYSIPDEDAAAELYLATCDTLRQGGLERYEISNFAVKGRQSRHNTKYWTGADYLGLGPGAHSLIGDRRFYYERDISAYLTAPTPIEDGCGKTAEEALMLGLRLSRGISVGGYVDRFFAGEQKIKDRLINKAELYRGAGLIKLSGDIISLTDRGAVLSNGVIGGLLDCL